MANKLLRSVLMKAWPPWWSKPSRRDAPRDWKRIRSQIARQLAGDGRRHRQVPHRHRQAALRRSKEIQDSAGYLTDLGVPAEMTTASAAALTRIAEKSARAARPCADPDLRQNRLQESIMNHPQTSTSPSGAAA